MGSVIHETWQMGYDNKPMSPYVLFLVDCWRTSQPALSPIPRPLDCLFIQRRHALRCYCQAMQVYKERGWSLAEDHINFTIGRQSFTLRQPENAVIAFRQILTNDSRQTATQQGAFLREYLYVYKVKFVTMSVCWNGWLYCVLICRLTTHMSEQRRHSTSALHLHASSRKKDSKIPSHNNYVDQTQIYITISQSDCSRRVWS